MKWLAPLFLVILASSFAVSLLPNARSIDVDKVLGQPYYFHNDLSGIGSYRIANATAPIRTQNLTYTRQAPIGVYEVGSGWIFPAVPRDINLSKYYNFFFSVWANSTATGNATLFWRFYYYRNNQENFLFTSKQSDILPWDNVTYTEMLWQHNIGDRTIRILQGDRLVLRLFINVTIAGTFSVGYDCVSMPSYAQDPTETRYMRNALNDNPTYPLNYTMNYGTAVNGSLANLTVSDDVRMWFNNGTFGGLGRMEVIFNGTISGVIPYLQVDAEILLNITTATAYFSAYNFTKGGYEKAGNMFKQFTPTLVDVHYYLFSIFNGTDYRNATTGEWKLNLTITAPLTAAARWTTDIDYLTFRSVSYQLGTAQTATTAGNDVFLDGLSVGSRVWKTNSTFQEGEITSGSNIATVTAPSAVSAYRSNTWAKTETLSVNTTVIRIYQQANLLETAALNAGGLPLVFVTEDLNGATLDAATWNFTYHFIYRVIDDAVFFDFGKSTANSRIENFQYSYPAALTYLYYFPYITLNMQPAAGTSYQMNIGSLINFLWQQRSGNAYNATFQTLIPFAFQIASSSNYSVNWQSIISFLSQISSGSQYNMTWQTNIPFNFNVASNNPFPFFLTLYENYTTGDDSWAYIYNIQWAGQTFTPEISHNIMMVRLKLFRVGNPGNLTVGIRLTDAEGTPIGNDLTNATINANTLTTDDNGLWYSITLPTYYLSNGTKYAIVVRAPDAPPDGFVYVGWKLDRTDATYSAGSRWTAYEGWWSEDAADDFMFEEWGLPKAAAVPNFLLWFIVIAPIAAVISLLIWKQPKKSAT